MPPEPSDRAAPLALSSADPNPDPQISLQLGRRGFRGPGPSHRLAHLPRRTRVALSQREVARWGDVSCRPPVSDALGATRGKAMTPIWFNRAVKDDDGATDKTLRRGDLRLRPASVGSRVCRGSPARWWRRHWPPTIPGTSTKCSAPAELAPVLGRLKPSYTHHPEARRLVVGILHELGVDLDDCHLDVPKLRTAFPTGHLTKGIAFAFGGHRDTWYGSPQAQINWWLPIYSLASDNAMTFYPRYFAKPVANDSDRFNYYQRNAERRDVTKFIKEDPRIQPSAAGLDPEEPEVRLLPGSGWDHRVRRSAVACNRFEPDIALSRYSVDFRTVSRRDVEHGLGAPNVDTRCTGTALRDFHRASDAAAMPEALARQLDPVGPAEGQVAVFKPGA